MAELWHYRILGEEFGPISEASLKSLIGDGTIGAGDEVRQSHDSNWRRADAVFSTDQADAAAAEVRSTTDALDLDAMLAAPSPASDRAANTRTSGGSEAADLDLDALLTPAGASATGRRPRVGNDWYYRVSGQRFGPLNFEALFELVTEGRISRYDEIKAPGADDWVEAQSIVGLFPDEQLDLDTLITNEADAPPPVGVDLLQSRPKLKWYYKVLNQQLGPVDFEALFELVMERNLAPDDLIRVDGESEWSRADSLVGLFPDDILAEAEPQPVATSAQPVDTAEGEEGEEREWYYQMDGETGGPISFSSLMRMAERGRLRRDDPIRLTRLGAWMDAGSMVGLFPDAPPEPATPPATAAPPKTSAVPERPQGDADDWAAAVLSEPAPEAKPPVHEPPAVAATPPPAAAPVVPRPTYTPPAPAQRPAFTPPPKAKRSGPAFSLPSGLGDSLTDPKVLIGGGVALLVVAFFFLPMGGLFSAGSADLIQELDGIWTQTKALYEKDASEAEWSALATQLDPKLKEIAETAKGRGAGPKNPGLQIAYLLASDHIPKVLADKQTTTKIRITTVDNFLARGKDAAK